MWDSTVRTVKLLSLRSHSTVSAHGAVRGGGSAEQVNAAVVAPLINMNTWWVGFVVCLASSAVPGGFCGVPGGLCGVPGGLCGVPGGF